GLTIAAQQLLEYIDYEKEVGYFLFQTLKNPTAQYEKVEYTNRYPFSARVFVPGMAQLHKGSAAKGIAFIAGEAAMVGGIVAFESMRTSYLSKIDATPSPSLQKQYAADADNMKNLRNGFIAGAAAVYVWNVIDGIAAKGKKHILVGENSLRIAPYATPYENGISLSLNF
ncbi:MAG: hypothetical protein LBS16_03565, partial [Prevotellaceae bacterium]|nr:hypothetical protein [Prevotellaceae bacterium]